MILGVAGFARFQISVAGLNSGEFSDTNSSRSKGNSHEFLYRPGNSHEFLYRRCRVARDVVF